MGCDHAPIGVDETGVDGQLGEGKGVRLEGVKGGEKVWAMGTGGEILEGGVSGEVGVDEVLATVSGGNPAG